MSVGLLLRDAIEDQFAINSALPRTLGALVLRPGLLTAEYLAGRIARYIPPVRLYLVASVLFFLLLSLSSFLRSESGPVGDGAIGSTEDLQVLDVRILDDGAYFGVQTDTETAPDTVIVWLNLGHDRINERAAARIRELGGASPGQIGRAVATAALGRAPAGMFVLLPVFALLLKLAYARSGRFYVQHFIFALHTHAFAFLLLTLSLPFADTPVQGLVLLWIAAYSFLAMRRVYQGRFLGTFVRFLGLAFAYTMLLSVVMMGVVTVAIVFG